MKLSGIQRIGIVLSVIAFIGFTAFVWIWGKTEAEQFMLARTRVCFSTFTSKRDAAPRNESAADAEKRAAANQSELDRCDKQAFDAEVRHYEETSKGFPILLAAELAVIVFGWLVTWFLIGIGRWIRRGFA
jgi:hypothetical protein